MKTRELLAACLMVFGGLLVWPLLTIPNRPVLIAGVPALVLPLRRTRRRTRDDPSSRACGTPRAPSSALVPRWWALVVAAAMLDPVVLLLAQLTEIAAAVLAPAIVHPIDPQPPFAL